VDPCELVRPVVKGALGVLPLDPGGDVRESCSDKAHVVCKPSGKQLLQGITKARVEEAQGLRDLVSLKLLRLNSSFAEIAKRPEESPPGPAVLLQRIGLLSRHLGDPVRAEASYRRALVLRPDYAEVHNNLGFLLESSGYLSEAAGHYSQAIAIDPDYVRALVNLARLRLEASDPDLRDPGAALELATRVQGLLGPDDPDAARLLAQARAARPVPEEARQR